MLMKVDVLNVFDTIKICTHYKLSNGTLTDMVPYEIVHEKIDPVYKEVKGWNCPLKELDGNNLPKDLLAYIKLLESELNVPIMLLSTGPDRQQTIMREN